MKTKYVLIELKEYVDVDDDHENIAVTLNGGVIIIDHSRPTPVYGAYLFDEREETSLTAFLDENGHDDGGIE